MKRGLIIWIIVIAVIIALGIILVKSGVTGNLVSSAGTACTDEDGGENIFAKGTTSIVIAGAVVSKTDSCSGKAYVIEYSCEKNFFSTKGFIAEQRIACEGVCNDGACAAP